MKGSKHILNVISYVALVIVALLLIISTGLPLVGIIISGPIINLLSTIKEIFVLIVIGVSAYNFASNNKKWVKVLFWISIVVFIVATVLLWL